jgi:hypothetical protein
MQTLDCCARGVAKVIVARMAEAAGEAPVLNTTEPKTLVLPGESDTFSGSTLAPDPAEISGIAEEL